MPMPILLGQNTVCNRIAQLLQRLIYTSNLSRVSKYNTLLALSKKTRPPHQPVEVGFPCLSTQPISVDYIENRHEEFRDECGELPCRFDPSRQKFVARPVAALSDSAEELKESKLRVVATTESFSKALLALKKKKSKDKNIASFDLDACHDWKEITELIQGVVTNYYKSDTTWARIRSGFRSVGDNAKSIQCFVGLLPDGEYQTLCGGLTIILTAMTEHSEVRERMADLLHEVPEVVSKCEQYQTLYPGRNTIQLCVNDIYTNLLIALERILDWYKQSSWNLVLIGIEHTKDSLLKNNNYGKAIDDCLKNIRQSKSSFIEETHLYLAWSQKATLSTALKINSQSREMNSNILRVDERVVQVSDRINSLKDHFDDAIKNAHWNNEINRLAEDLKLAQLSSQADKRRISELEERVAKTAITPERLMKELKLNRPKHTHVVEVSTVLIDGLNSPTKFQNRAGWVGNTTEFRNWLGGPVTSQILGIQGHGEFQKISPLSFLISLLYEKLEDTPRTLVLPFFCGLSRVRSGPAIMLRAFLIQLLASCDAHEHMGDDKFPLLSILGHDDVSNMKGLCFQTYMEVLTQLLQELRKNYNAIFILIDAVEFYDSEWEEEMDDFVKSMRKLVKSFNKPDDETSGGVLRVLLTASSWSKRFLSPPKSLVVLDVPEYIDGPQDGFEKFT